MALLFSPFALFWMGSEAFTALSFTALSVATAGAGLLLFLLAFEGTSHRALVAAGLAGTVLMHLAASVNRWRFPSVEAAPLVAFLGIVLVAAQTRAPLAQLAKVGVGVVVFGFLGARGVDIVNQQQVPCFGDGVFPTVMLWTAVLTSAIGIVLRRAAPRLPWWVATSAAVIVSAGAATLGPEPFSGSFLFPTLAACGAVGFELGRKAYGAVVAVAGRSGTARAGAAEFLFSLAVMQAFSVLPVWLLQIWLSDSGC
ncbi:hypothetical protein [Brevundimonas sp.]|uniref:hypothetical protein n=1 Tax=Brevundimonas sp. TaxID=1871086 RepID=UPI00272F1DE7|nr:hypothetical protein [Brevundimonas sp.]MDP1912052.1 hypothetical protein [Brevundimonas sp.]